MEVRKIKSHSKLSEFRKQKSEAKQILRMRIFEEVHDIKKLDKHVDEFKKAIEHDIKVHHPDQLRKHADDFEHEVHEELARLIELTRDDLKLYTKVFKSLQEFEKTMHKLALKDRTYVKIADAEIKYAELINKSMNSKLDSLEKTFRRMRK